MKRSLLALLLILQFSLPAPAKQTEQKSTGSPHRPERPSTSVQNTQQPIQPADEDVVHITTNLVQVDAMVTDKNGKPVADLRPEEVEIQEDGRPQKVTHFSYISTDAPLTVAAPGKAASEDKNTPPVPPVRLRPEEVRRTIALVVDDLGLSFESASYVRGALKKFVDAQMQRGDLVAIIRTGGGIGALQQFTSDKRQLYAAIERVKWYPNGRGGIGAFAPIGSDEAADRSSETEGANEDLNQFREDIFAVGTLGALSYVVRGLRELPGRKSVLLISDGIKIFNRDDPSRSNRVLQALLRLTDLANRASVVIYTMDARGLQTLGLTAADATNGLSAAQVEQQLSNRRSDLFESQNGLNYLAQQTGGLAIRNNNDLSGGIRRVMEDQRGYYLIGYRPDESTFEEKMGRRKFHRLNLRVTRPGKFNVRMRKGFYGITDEEAVPQRKTAQQQLIGALISPFGSAGVQLRLTSFFANDAKQGSVMRSFLHVKASDLTFTDEPDDLHKAVFDIMAVTFGDNGSIVDQIGRTHTIQLKGATYQRVLKEGFTYNITVPIKKPGAYQLRTAVRDESSERVGSASQFIEVPDIKKNRLMLSGIVMRGIPFETFKKTQAGASSEARGADDTVEEFDPRWNAAMRQLQNGLVAVYGYVIYNAQLNNRTKEPQLQSQVRLFRNGQQVFAGNQIPVDPTNQSDLKRLSVAGALQLGTQLDSGEYVFQIVVTDTLAKEKNRVASQWIDFEIVK